MTGAGRVETGGAIASATPQQIADLYDHGPCGHLLTEPSGKIVHANETLLGWLGYRPEDVVNRLTFQDLLTAGGRIYHETHYSPLLRMQDAVNEIAVDLRTADGERIPVLINSLLLRDGSGRPTAIQTAVFKATDRREYESELLRARQAAEEAAARVRVLAQTLQSSLIPPAAPSVPDLEIGSIYRPAGDGAEVGGDFYDIFETGRGDWAIVLGDVCGKGVEAARVTALARYTVRAAAMRTRRPKQILGTLNEALLQQGTDRFCTVVYARVRPAPGRACRVTVSSGGHALPLRLSAQRPTDEVGRSGSLLGVLDGPVLHESTLELQAGEALVFFTDGVTEARRGQEFFGEPALLETLEAVRDEDAQGMADAVLAKVMAFQDGVARDDIAIVVLKVPQRRQT